MLKNFTLTRALHKQLNKALTDKPLAVFEGKISKVLVLVPTTEPIYQDHFKDLHLGLGLKATAVHLLHFKQKISKKEERPFNVITPKQFNGKGQVTGSFAPFDPTIKYDLIIAYYEQPEMYLNSLVINQGQAFKVGLMGNHEQLFHFILTTKIAQFDLFIAELLRYLRILKYIA
jgi:hypothetical protein